MANYKKISEIETVTEVTESMNVLIEDDGVLKKVSSGGNIGGGGIKTIVLVQNSYTPGVGYGNSPKTCTCETGETYGDVVGYFNDGTPFMILIKEIYDSSAGYTIASKVYPDTNNGEDFITIIGDKTFYWNGSINTETHTDKISISKPGDEGAQEPS